MTKMIVAVLAALSLAACGKKSSTSDALAKLEGFQKQMCECKDKACADRVQEDMTRWGTEAAKLAKQDDRPDPETVKKSGEVMTKYTECMTKAMGPAMGGDMKGGDMKGGDMKGGDMQGDMKGGDMKGGDMKGGDMKDEKK